VYLKQITNDKTGCVSYVGYCFSCKVGYVVDPLEDIDFYLQVARDNGIQITHVFNTHIQADHASGDRKLAEKTGAKIYMHESADVKYDFSPLKEKDVLAIGNPQVKVIHTHGHTPESISLLFTEYLPVIHCLEETRKIRFRGRRNSRATI
jgi:hydroxyacylglutathione hydrolase